MTLFRQNITQLAVEKSIRHRISVLRRHFLRIVNHFIACSISRPARYHLLPSQVPDQSASPSSANTTSNTSRYDVQCDSVKMIQFNHDHASDPDLVPLKITLLGDCLIGKTSFLEKYVGEEKVQGGTHNHMRGLTQMDKTFVVSGARISFCIWEVNGERKNDHDYMPKACQDSVSILFMFDLTNRCTLNSVISWYKEAMKSNQAAIPVLIGTKFDEFIQLPLDMQWTIASEARAIAKALKAILFFSSTTYNINVNKVFKFIAAKLFDLPWTVERNLNVGEPIIDF